MSSKAMIHRKKQKETAKTKRRPRTFSSKSNVTNASLNSLMGSTLSAVVGGQRSV